MKHQKTSGMLRGAWFILLLIIISGGLHAWQVDVYVNGSTEGATMSFGEGTFDVAPMPPFSGMYGVVDVYLANPGNVYPPDVSQDIQQYYNRLSVDIKAANQSNRWVLVAGSSARLTWKKVGDDPIPGNFKIVWNENDGPKTADVTDGATLSVKTGITYYLGVGADANEVLPDPNSPTKLIGKDDEGKLGQTTIDISAKIPEDHIDADGYTISVNLNAGTTLLAFPLYDADPVYNADEPPTGYRPNNGGADIPPDAIAAAGAWIVEIRASGYTVAMAWDLADPNILIATLTKIAPPTRGAGDWQLLAQPTRSGLAALSANPELTSVTRGQQTEDVDNTPLGNLIAIIQQLGTLDFDGNGVANGDDAIFLFNFASRGGSASTRPTHLMPFTTNTATLEDAEKALNFFRANLGDLYFDGTDQATGQLMDNAIYLYNFASRNFSGTTRVTHLLPFTTNAASAELAGKALAIMREYLENN